MNMNYEELKNRLFIKAIPLERAVGAVYKTVGDIALTVYILIEETSEEITSARLPVVDNVDVDTLWNKAMENTVSMWEPRTFDAFDFIINPNTKGSSIETITDTPFGACLSNPTRTNGAAAIFYPNVAKHISDLMGGVNLYIVFTSIHEATVHNAETTEPYDLISALDSALDFVDEKDFLSKNIYIYNKDTNKITMGGINYV